MCGTSRGYTYEKESNGIGRHDCECGGTHEKNGKCLRCGKPIDCEVCDDNNN